KGKGKVYCRFEMRLDFDIYTLTAVGRRRRISTLGHYIVLGFL
ncbi:MAG: hypothetical protein ACI90V_007685, partial [Bacillariaceae sp.]